MNIIADLQGKSILYLRERGDGMGVVWVCYQADIGLWEQEKKNLYENHVNEKKRKGLPREGGNREKWRWCTDIRTI